MGSNTCEHSCVGNTEPTPPTPPAYSNYHCHASPQTEASPAGTNLLQHAVLEQSRGSEALAGILRETELDEVLARRLQTLHRSHNALWLHWAWPTISIAEKVKIQHL